MPTTRWTLVANANAGSEEDRLAALEALCRLYWHPLYSFVRQQGHTPEDAQDLTQAFFAHMLGTAKRGLGSAKPERGQFRSFLLASLGQFLSDHWDRSTALKRGGGAVPISLDRDEAERRYLAQMADDLDPATLFELQWAKDLLAGVYSSLEREYQTRGKSSRFELLRGHLQAGRGEMTYAEIGARLGITEGAVAQEANTMRQRFGEILWRRIRDTVESEADVKPEIAHLIHVASRR